MPSKLYTNADLKPRTPLRIDVEKPAGSSQGWSGPVSHAEVAGYGPSQDTILADALSYLNDRGLSANPQRPTVANALARLSSPEGQYAAREQSDKAALAAEHSLRIPETIARYAAPLKQGLDVGMGIGSMIPSPIQPAAGAYMGLRGAEEFADQPSLQSLLFAGLGALPFVGKAKGLLNEAKAAKAATTAAEYERTGYGATGYASNARKVKPSEGGYVNNPTPKPTPPSSGGPTGTAFSPGKMPNPPSWSYSQSDMLNPKSLDTMDRMGAEAQMLSKPAPGGGQWRAATGRNGKPVWTNAPEEAAVPPSIEALGRPEGRGLTRAAQEKILATETPGWSDVPLDFPEEVIAAAPKAPKALVGGRKGQTHGRQTTGGEFGFPDLPKISEAELTRLQKLFKRTTGK